MRAIFIFLGIFLSWLWYIIYPQDNSRPNPVDQVDTG